MCIGWRETSCGTNIRTPSQDLPCDAVIPGNANGANSGFCECTFGITNVVFGCGDPFPFTTCNAACGFQEGDLNYFINMLSKVKIPTF